MFYKGYNYGSQANYNPFFVTINSSSDILQLTNRNNDLRSYDLRAGMRNVNWNLERAFYVIDRYGWDRFIKTELVPTTLKATGVQYWPNYKLHLIGGGMSYVATAEWFEYHGIGYPRVNSLITMAAMHYLNEIVENNRYSGPNVDPLADLLIFDPLGIVLFSIDGVPEFFANRLNMADWSFQPMYNPATYQLLNNGQKFSFKIPVPFYQRLKFFYLTGIEGMAGATYALTETDDFTVSSGMAAHELDEVDNNTGVRTLYSKLIWTHGIFYDRNNSLLASLILGGPRGYRARLNLYPGVLKYRSFSPGLAFLLQENNNLVFGIFLRYLPVGGAFSIH
ncbi:hypothetical protein ACFLQJ_00295 [Calditrichota bacterium]